MLVILNPAAGGGSADRRWQTVEGRFRDLVGHYSLVRAHDASAAREAIRIALARGERDFVAAGGDGTVNLVANSLRDLAPPEVLPTVRLGALGLGSSNDFHKTHPPGQRLGKVPHRLDFARAIPHDVGVVRFETPDGTSCERLWLINASVGVTAEANDFFNRSGRVLRVLKRLSPWRGMVWAAVRTILAHRPRPLRLAVDGTAAENGRPRNIAVVKNPHFTGALRYDSPHEPASGSFHVHIIGTVGLPRLAAIIAGLARGRFSGRPGTTSRRARHLEVGSPRPFAMERDGEVVNVCRATFSILPHRLLICP